MNTATKSLDLAICKTSPFGWTVVVRGVAYEVQKQDRGLAFVKHFSGGETHWVQLDYTGCPFSCNCGDAHYRHAICKHQRAALTLLGIAVETADASLATSGAGSGT